MLRPSRSIQDYEGESRVGEEPQEELERVKVTREKLARPSSAE